MIGHRRRTALAAMLACLCAGALLVAAAGRGAAQTYRERGAHLVNAVAVFGNCHKPRAAANTPIPGMELAGGGEVRNQGGPIVRSNTPPARGIGVGGREFPDFGNPEARTVSRNITPDPETGIGKWSDADVKRAILIGQRPDGTNLSRTMPSADYFNMTSDDVNAIVDYLRTLKPLKPQ